jgi:hypothetical protein
MSKRGQFDNAALFERLGLGVWDDIQPRKVKRNKLNICIGKPLRELRYIVLHPPRIQDPHSLIWNVLYYPPTWKYYNRRDGECLTRTLANNVVSKPLSVAYRLFDWLGVRWTTVSGDSFAVERHVAVLGLLPRLGFDGEYAVSRYYNMVGVEIARTSSANKVMKNGTLNPVSQFLKSLPNFPLPVPAKSQSFQLLPICSDSYCGVSKNDHEYNKDSGGLGWGTSDCVEQFPKSHSENGGHNDDELIDVPPDFVYLLVKGLSGAAELISLERATLGVTIHRSVGRILSCRRRERTP